MAHLAQTRDLLVKQRSALKAKINNLLSAEGINLKKEALSSNKALDRVLALPLSPIVAAEARVLVAQIRSLTGSIAELEELIEEEGPELAGHENLMSIKGIGPVSASGAVKRDRRRSTISPIPASWLRISAWCQECRTPTKPNAPGASPSRATSCAHRAGTVRADRQTIQLVPAAVLSTHPAPPRRRQSQHRTGAQIPGSHIPHPQEQLGVRGLPQLRPGLLKTGHNTA